MGATPAPATSLPAPRVPDTTNDVVTTQKDFRVVKNNVTPRRRIIPITSCQNRFQILSDTRDDEDTEKVILVGDSIVRGQLTEFCGRAPRTRKRFCIPGGGVQDVIAAVDVVVSQAPTTTTFVIHVGTNGVHRT